MRKELKKFIAYVVFVFVVGFSAYFYYGSVQSAEYDGTVVPYIQKVLPEISTWDPDVVKQYLAPEVSKTVSPENLKNILAELSKIGELQSIEKMKFKKKSTGGEGDIAQQPVVTYTVIAQYSTGETTVTISLLDRGGSYEVHHFNFESGALFQ